MKNEELFDNKLHVPSTAIELWKRWFDWSGDPWVDASEFGRVYCFFCGENHPNHEPHCVFVTAQKLVALDEKGIEWTDKLST